VAHVGPLQVWWGGHRVGALTGLELETIDLFESYKIQGQWAPTHGSEAQAFLYSLATASRVEVTVNVSPLLGDFFGTGMEVMFSLASPDKAWLYVRDLEGRKRLTRLVEVSEHAKQGKHP
jgi:hypothetical protein